MNLTCDDQSASDKVLWARIQKSAVFMMQPCWRDALASDEAFHREQFQLEYVWTFLGFAQDVASENDWFRAQLGIRSVFVQRFGDELVGFENRCAHRFYPLRLTDKGNGPIVCGFHHWRYNKRGQAVGIPMCPELFGKTPRELGARLDCVEIATCGNLIFGRFPSSPSNGSLVEFLGVSFPILEALSKPPATPQCVTRVVHANWRLCYHISLEDYHTVAVHPSTFGKMGYLRRENIGYFRFGSHSCYFTNADPEAINKMADACRSKSWVSENYRVFHVFPNLAVSHFNSDGHYWYIMVLQYVPVAHNRSVMRAWVYPAPFAAPFTTFERWTRPFTQLFRRLAVRHYAAKVLQEDNEVCEQLQTVARQINAVPILGKLEERIQWFEEAYARAVSAAH